MISDPIAPASVLTVSDIHDDVSVIQLLAVFTPRLGILLITDSLRL